MESFDEYFGKRGFTREFLIECGGETHDDSVFYNMFDYASRPQGYVERRLNTQPRYVNGLTSSDTLYPIHKTAFHIEQAGEAIVVEGPSDALALLANNHKNVVSFQGASNFGKRKLRLLRRHCESVWFILDRDEAGMQFAKHIRERLHLDFPAYMSFTPEGYKDPAAYIASGKGLELIRRHKVV